MTSDDPMDVAARYCATCKLFHQEVTMSEEIAAADSLLRTNADLRSEIARLQAEIVKAEAGVLALLKMNEASLRSYCGRCGSCHRCIRELPILTATHPGAALLAELEAARAAVEKWRYMPRYYDDCDPGQNDPYYAWWAEMGDLVAAYDEALKEKETT